MPNYSIVIDSTFKPFTYQELTAPLDRAEAYHEKLAQEYDTLSSQADILEAMGKDDRDKESGAYSRYKAYSDSLRKEADDLYRYGLNVESRRRLSDIRRRYNTDIVPIQNAWNKRQEEVKAQQDLMAKNPGVMFTRDANQTSIDAYIDNPMGGYQTINPDNIYKDMYTAAKNLEKQIRGGHLEGIDPYTARYITNRGLDPNLITEWIADPSRNATLTAMMNQVLQKNGVTLEALQNSPNLDRIMQASTNAAQLGAWGAVGEDNSQMMELFGPRQDRRDASEINNYLRKKDIDSNIASQQAVRNEGNIPLFFEKITAPGTDGKPQQVKALELRYENNRKVLEDDLLPKLLMSDNKTYIKEVSSIGKDGKVVSKDKYIDVGEFVDNKGNAKTKPLFYRINSPNGSNSIIMKYGTKSYLIPGEKLGDVFGESNVDVENLQRIYDIRQKYINTYGEDAYWSDPASAEIENALNRFGASSVRRASTGITGRYKTPVFNLVQTSEDKQE